MEVVEVGRRVGPQTTLTDLSYATTGSEPSAAYLVAPNESAAAGILYFHWLEPRADDSNRTEFLGEATRMAERGAVSLLVEGDMPWHRRPSHSSADPKAIENQVERLSAGLNLLIEHGAPPENVAVVGHDFGAMYGVLLALSDRRPRAYVLMAATPRWGDWFVPYWRLDETVEHYNRQMRGVEPIDAVASAAPAAVLFQFARRDHQYVPIDVAERFHAAASEPKELRWYSCGHRTNHLAGREREDWVASRLGLRAQTAQPAALGSAGTDRDATAASGGS